MPPHHSTKIMRADHARVQISGQKFEQQELGRLFAPGSEAMSHTARLLRALRCVLLGYKALRCVLLGYYLASPETMRQDFSIPSP
eukprot:scaffold14628_cov19-Tisochrysis_lutea.AAC.1